MTVFQEKQPSTMRKSRLIKQFFCKHSFNAYWNTEFDGGEVIFSNHCTRCGKSKKISMPADNVKPAWEHYIWLRKQHKA